MSEELNPTEINQPTDNASAPVQETSTEQEQNAQCLSSSCCGKGCGNNFRAPRGKLQCYDWLADVPVSGYDIVEVQFKNTRKGFFVNSLHLPLKIGDWVAVEAAPGHDIGQVTLTGMLVARQMHKAGVKSDAEIRRVLRKARQADLDRFEEVKAKENDTMIRARKIAEDLNLNMKIGDVEYQGDGNKAIFYYIADERVDFRQLIKVLAEAFRVRIEMKQIGARQEAGRIGGIGPCGRALCCASWMTNFVSVGTAAARFQDISLNPQKLAGQCAKLKCCLNFEVDSYVEALKHLPGKDVKLETADATWHHFKYDVFNHTITYSSDRNIPANLTTINAERAFEIIAMNKEGEKPLTLTGEEESKSPKKAYNDILDQDNISRFDKKKRNKKNRSRQKTDSAPAEERTENNNVSSNSAEQAGNGEKSERSDRNPNANRSHGNDRRRRNRGDNRNNSQRNSNQPPQQNSSTSNE